MLLIFLKKGTEEFEALKGLIFAFHGIDTRKFGKIIDECDKIFIKFPRSEFIRPYIGMNELAWTRRTIREARLEWFSRHFALKTCWTLLYLDLVHHTWYNVVRLEESF